MIKDTRLRILTTIGLGGNNPSKKACGPGPTGRRNDCLLEWRKEFLPCESADGQCCMDCARFPCQ